jgi:hypothetical protein
VNGFKFKFSIRRGLFLDAADSLIGQIRLRYRLQENGTCYLSHQVLILLKNLQKFCFLPKRVKKVKV